MDEIHQRFQTLKTRFSVTDQQLAKQADMDVASVQVDQANQQYYGALISALSVLCGVSVSYLLLGDLDKPEPKLNPKPEWVEFSVTGKKFSEDLYFLVALSGSDIKQTKYKNPARALRLKRTDPYAPVPDLLEFVEAIAKVPVAFLEGPKDLAGMIYQESGRPMIITLNFLEISIMRQSLAHMLGHVMLGHEIRMQSLEDVLDPNSEEEVLASEFAKEFLMPDEFGKTITNLESLCRASLSCGVEIGFLEQRVQKFGHSIDVSKASAMIDVLGFKIQDSLQQLVDFYTQAQAHRVPRATQTLAIEMLGFNLIDRQEYSEIIK